MIDSFFPFSVESTKIIIIRMEGKEI